MRSETITALKFGGLWSLAMGVSSFMALLLTGWNITPHMAPVVLLYGLAGLPGGFAGWKTAIWLSRGKSDAARFSALIVSLVLWTGLLTALLFSLQYRQYYSQAHFPPLTVVWAFQFLFTGLASFYLFAVQGFRLFLPFGAIALFCAGIAFARWSR